MRSPVPHDKRVRLFASDKLERLTMISPRAFLVSWAILLPLIAIVGWGRVDFGTGVVSAMSGLAFWFVFEYAMHRYIFHWESRWTPIRWVVFLIHGNHHQDPNDPMRNLMPPILSVPLALCIWGGLYLLFGQASTWIFLGFMTGYVTYDVTHFACHQWPMKSALGYALKRHHMRHHYVNERANYAITAIFLDRIVGSDVRQFKKP